MTTSGKTMKGVMVVTVMWRCRRPHPPCCSCIYNKSSVFCYQSHSLIAPYRRVSCHGQVKTLIRCITVSKLCCT